MSIDDRHWHFTNAERDAINNAVENAALENAALENANNQIDALKQEPMLLVLVELHRIADAQERQATALEKLARIEGKRGWHEEHETPDPDWERDRS